MTKLVELREEIRGELKCVEAEEEIEGVCSVSVAGIVGGCGGSPETSLHAGAEYRDEPHQETTSFCVVSQQCTAPVVVADKSQLENPCQPVGDIWDHFSHGEV
ncbi:uncharacterized protein DS421_15g514240 [Arachis hypogaea]|nr:uncharacterized protein DS421_15g514240 [Arachis hypogaea]